MISIKRLLYDLKQRYGVKAAYYKVEKTDLDVLTGKSLSNTTKYNIKKAVFLEQRIGFRNPIIGKANPILPYSGLLEIGDISLLVDAQELPKNIIPLEDTDTFDDYIIFKNKRYEIKSIHIVDNNQAYYFIVREYKGSIVHEQHDINLHDKLTLIQIVSPKHEILWTQNLQTDILIFNDLLIVNHILYVRTINDIISINDNLQPPIIYNGTNYITYEGEKNNMQFNENLNSNIIRNRALSDTITFDQSMIRDELIISNLSQFIDIDQRLSYVAG